MLLCRFPTQKICSGQKESSRNSLLVSVPARAGGGEDPAEAEIHKATAGCPLPLRLCPADTSEDPAATS